MIYLEEEKEFRIIEIEIIKEKNNKDPSSEASKIRKQLCIFFLKEIMLITFSNI